MANMRADAQKANKEKEKKDLLKTGNAVKNAGKPAQAAKPTNTGKTNKTGNTKKGGKSGAGKKTTTTQTGKGNKLQTSAVKAAATPPEKKKTTPKTTTNTGHVKALLGGSAVNMRKDAQKANTLKTQLKNGGSYKTAAKPDQTVRKEKEPSLEEQWKSQAKEALKSLPKMPNVYQTEKQNRTFRPGKSKTPGILTPDSKARREGRQKLIEEPYTDLKLTAQQKGLKKSLQQVNDQLASGYYAPGSEEEAKANQQRKHWKEQLADVENQIEERKQAKYTQQNQSRAALMASEGKRDANYQATLQTGADTAKKLNNVMADRNRGQQIAKYIADPSYKTYLNQYRLTRASDVTAEEMRNLEYMTQEEKDTALYYAGKGDWQQIADYYDLLKRDLNARRRETESQKRQDFANKHKVLGGLQNIASGALTPMAAAATLGQAAKNKITGKDAPADPNSDWYMGPQIQGDTVQGVTRDMNTGGRIAAQTVLGLGQMAATLPMGGAALPMMGLQGAGTSGYQALQNGASTGNAARNAIASGLLNYVSAKLPVERLLKTAGGQVTPNTVKGILANAGLMASTDGATQMAETLTDMAINGRKSAYNQYVNKLTASGYSTEAAKRQANLQFFVKDIAETMAVSGLTGGLLGAGAELQGRRLQTAREAALAEQLAQKIAARMEGRTEPGRAELLDLPGALELAQAKKNTGYLDTPVENLRPAGAQYKILRGDDGTDFVQATSDIIDGVPKKRHITVLNNIVRNKFNNVLTANGQSFGINSKTAREWRFSKNAQYLEHTDKQKFFDKERIFNHADELMQASHDYVGEGQAHSRKDKFVEFARGKVDYRVGENGYTADVIVGIRRSGQADLYDIVNIQNKKIKETSVPATVLEAQKPIEEMPLSDNSITLNGEKNNGFGRNSFGLTPDMTPAEVAERGLRTYAEDEAFQQAKNIANQLGAKLEVADLGGASGKYEDGTITLNPNSKTPVQQVLVHELTHHLESSGFYKDLQTAAIRALSEEQGISPDMLRQSIANLYEKNGVKLDAEGADRELAATFCENRLFQDEGSIQRLAQTDFNLFQKIRQWLSDVVVRLKGTAEEKRLLEVQRLYEKAARDVGKQAKKQGAQGESRYRFADRKIPSWKELTKKPDMKVVDIREKSDKRFSEQRKDFLNSEEAKRLYEEPVINKDTGEKVFITPKSLKHSFNNEGQVQISAAKQIEKIIENAVLTHSEAVTHGDPSATGVYTLFGAVRTENGIQPVKLKVKEYSFNGQYIPQTIANYFERYGAPKDYSSAYDNKVLALEDIKKEDASSSIATMPDDLSGVNYPSASSTIKVTELLGLVKGDSEKYVPKPDVRYSLEESDPLHTALPTYAEVEAAQQRLKRGDENWQEADSKTEKLELTPEERNVLTENPKIRNRKLSEVEQALRDEWDSIDTEDLLPEKKQKIRDAGSFKAGKITRIYGRTDMEPANQTEVSKPLTIDNKTYSQAKRLMDLSWEDPQITENFYDSVNQQIWPHGVAKKMELNTVTMNGKPYPVWFRKGSIDSKGPIASPEWIALLPHLEDAIQTANYVGSGSRNGDNEFNSWAGRYDYFEKEIYFDNVPYYLKFQVENGMKGERGAIVHLTLDTDRSIGGILQRYAGEDDPLHTMLPTGKEAADREWQARKNAKRPEIPLEEMAPAEVAKRGLKTYAEVEAAQQRERKQQTLNEVIVNNHDKIEQTGVLAELKGSEFAVDKKKLIEKVTDFFNKLGNKVSRAGFGDVTLNRSGARDSISHGMGRNKAIAFSAVPEIIQKGTIIDEQRNWKDRGYDTVTFGGQIKIGEKTYDMGVIVKKYDNPNMASKYYLHEVVMTNEKGETMSFKTGTREGYPSDTISPLEKSIPQDGENSNPSKSVWLKRGDEGDEELLSYLGDGKTKGERGEALQGEPLPTYGEVAEEKERIAKIRKEYPNEGNPVEEDYIQNNNREINFRTEEKWSFQPEEAQEIQSKNLGSFLHSAYWMDFSRALDKVCGKNKKLRDYMTQKLEKPLMDAKNEFAHKTKERLDGYYQDMKRLGIQKGSKESTAVMWYGEGERLNADGDVEPYTLDDLKRDFPENWKKIWQADKINRKIYDDYLNRMNAVLEQLYPNVRQEAETKLGRLKNAYNATGTDYKIEQLENAIRRIEDKEIITKEDRELLAAYEKNLNQLHISRSDAHNEINQLISQIKSGEIYRGKRILPRKDYYHHFKEFEGGFSGLKNILSEDFDIDPKLVGVSDNTKPKQKWASWMQKRGEGHDTSTDSVAGMLKYIQEAEYKIAIDPVTARFRTVIRDIADGTQATRNANRFLEWLTDYTNDLAGKTNSADRHKQKEWSRKTMKAVQWLNNRIKANAVMGNLSSAVSQVYNLPNVLGYVKNPRDITLGVKDYIQYRVLGNTEKQQAIDSSGFLTERYLSNYVDKFDESILAKPEKFAAWLLEVGDKSVAEAGWFMAYNQGMRKNVKDPVMYADDMIRRSVGGRGIGEIPLDLKSNVVKLMAPFQIEVNNAYQALREMVGKKDALGIIMILGSTYLLNEIRENYIDGRRTGLDLIDAALDGAKNAEEKDNGIEKFGAVAGRMGGELLSNLPYGSQIASTVGITDDLAEGLFGDSDPTRFGTGLVGASAITQPLAKLATGKGKIDLLDPAMKLLLPFGGAQAVRSKNALEDLGILPKVRASGKGFEMTKKEGAYNDDGNLKYPLDSKNPVDFLTAALLGSSATKSGKEYVKTGDGSLNETQTKAYEKLVAAGLDQMTSWHKIKELAKIKGDKDEDGDTIQGSQAKNQSAYLLNSGLSTSDQAKIYFAVVADEYTQNRKAHLAKDGVDESDYYRFLMKIRNTVGDQDEKGKTIQGSEEKNKLKELEKMKLNDQQKAAIYFTDFASKQHQKQMEKLEKRGVDASTYYRYLYDTKDIEKAKDENGEAISGSDLIRKLEYLEKSQKYDKETAAKLLYFDLDSTSGIVKAYDKNADQMRKKGVGGYDYLKFMAVVLGAKADKDKNGESIRNSKKKKVLAYVDAMDISDQAKDALYLSNDWSAKNLGKTPWHTGEDWSRYMPTYDYLNENYQNGTAKENEKAIYGDAVSFGGGNSSTGAELKAGNGNSGGSYYGSSSGYSRKGRKSRKKSSGRRRSNRSSSRSSSAAANQLLRASQAMNLVNGQFDSSGYVSRVKNLMTNLGIDAGNAQVPELINVLGGLTAAQKQEIYSGVGGTNTVNFDDGLTTGGGDGSLLSSLGSGGFYYSAFYLR